MKKKYKLTNETIIFKGTELYRIEALEDFSDVKKGDKGGFVQSENNLSHDGNCWVYDTAKIHGNALIFGNAKVYDDAEVFDNVDVCGNAKVYDNAEVSGYTRICGDAKIENDWDYIVFKNFWSSGRYFTWTRSNNKWSVGCFYGTGKELIEKAYKDSKMSGREYERVVNYVESMLKKDKIKNSSKIVKYFKRTF